MRGFTHKRPRQVVPVWEQDQWRVIGVTLLQREALKAKAVGEASTVKVEAVVCTTLTARSELYNGAVLHAANWEHDANAPWSFDFGGRCGREKLRLAAATSDRHRIATGKATVFGFCSRALSFVTKRKTRSLGCPQGWLQSLLPTAI